MTNNPTYAQLLKSPVLLLAFGFGSGLSPKAPGTVGSFLALVLWLFLAKLSLPFYLVFVAICAVAGVYICGVAADRLGVHDHGGIVWDEFVGLWVAMAALPVSWASIILGFGLFRLLLVSFFSEFLIFLSLGQLAGWTKIYRVGLASCLMT